MRRQTEPGDIDLFPQAGGDSKMFFRFTTGGQRTSGNRAEEEKINLISVPVYFVSNKPDYCSLLKVDPESEFKML